MRDAPLKPVHGLVWGVNDSNLVTYNKTALAKFVKLVPELNQPVFSDSITPVKFQTKKVYEYDIYTKANQLNHLKTKPVLHNNVVIHNNAVLTSKTGVGT